MYSDAVIGARIKTIFDDEHGLYGAKRIAASLKEDTTYTPINHKKGPDPRKVDTSGSGPGHPDGRPATYDTHIDSEWNPSLGIRKGWAGRA